MELTESAAYSQAGRLAESALHHAAYHGDDDVCELLLAAGAAIDATNASGVTALMLAAKWFPKIYFRILPSTTGC